MLTVAATAEDRANSFRMFSAIIPCRSSRDTGHKHRKFIATKTADHVCSAQVSARDVHQILQRLIASTMAVPIIDRFQVVEIKNGNVAGVPGRSGLFDRKIQRFGETLPPQRAGRCKVACEFAEPMAVAMQPMKG